MIAKIISWSVDNRFMVLMLTAFLIAFGIYSVEQTPLDALPDLSDVQVIVKTPYPGQAPQVVEDQVTYPLTTAMLSVPKAVDVRGYSFFGDSYVYIIFKDGTNLYWARSRVLEYLSQVSSTLPADAHPQLGPDATGVGWVYEYALVDPTGKHDESQLTTIQNWFLKYELQTVPGVSEVATIGGMVKQYQVVLDPDKLRAYNLPLEKIKKAIQNANHEAGGSVVEMAEAEYMVRATGYIKSLKDLQEVPLGVNKEGIPILLKDVATVRLGPEARRGVADLNGKGDVVGGVVLMRFGENALTTIEAVKARLKELSRSLPKGVKIVETYDRSALINRSVETLKDKLREEFIIVAIVCVVFLFHLRSALVVILSLPVGILIAFIVMHHLNISANIMSLGGIAIAIGAMVDGAIVMIENVHKHMERTEITDENRWQVMKEAAMEVGPALFFSLLVITLSFLPVFTLQAQEGRMFAPLAFTKTFSMAGAALLSITLVPVLMGYFIRGRILPEEKNPINRFLIAGYRPFINGVLHAPKTVLLIAFVFVVIGFWPLQHIGSEFMPELNEGDLLYMPSLYPAISIGKGRQILQDADRLIKTVPEVKSVFGKLGRAQSATDPAPLTMIETTVQLKPKSEWRKGMTMDKLKKELNALVNFPGVTNAWVMPIKNRIDMLATGIKTPVGIKVAGPDLKVIQKIGERIETVLRKVPGTVSVYAERVVGGRYITVDINRVAASRFALNISNIQDVVRTAMGGENVTTTVEGLDRFPVNMRYPRDVRNSLKKIRNLPIVTPTGATIPLAEVANVRVDDGPGVIKTENARLNGWIYIDITGRDLGGYVKDAQKAVEEHVKLPTGYSLSWSGQYEFMVRAIQRLKIVVPATLAIIMLLLYINFKDITEVLIIMATLPLALIGGFWLLYLLNYNMSVAVGVGFIALSGVTIEIGVVMLVYLNQALQKHKDEAKRKGVTLTVEEIRSAVIDGALMRVRPIMMTVVAVIAGLLPIMLGGGTGSQVMRRIAAPMVGGMVSSTILTLVVLPAVFLIWKSIGLKKKA